MEQPTGINHVDKTKLLDANSFHMNSQTTRLISKTKSQTIHLEFWQSAGSDYFVDWTYDQTANVYKRSNGGKPHLDKDTESKLQQKMS